MATRKKESPGHELAIVVLAAGASSRMGGDDKLMMDAGGTVLLARVIRRAKATGLAVFVTLPAPDHPRGAIARGLGVKIVDVPDWASGMAASVRAGVAALAPETKGVMILPADMPDLTTRDLNILAQTFDKKSNFVIRATSVDGVPGHPVIFPASLFEKLRGITGDQGARAVIAAGYQPLHLIALPDRHATCDLDTPADWAEWTARQDK